MSALSPESTLQTDATMLLDEVAAAAANNQLELVAAWEDTRYGGQARFKNCALRVTGQPDDAPAYLIRQAADGVSEVEVAKGMLERILVGHWTSEVGAGREEYSEPLDIFKPTLSVSASLLFRDIGAFVDTDTAATSYDSSRRALEKVTLPDQTLQNLVALSNLAIANAYIY